MISRIVSPAAAMLLALPLAVAVGPAWFWLKTDKLVAEVLIARQAKAKDAAAVVGARKAQGWDFWTIEMENLAAELKEEKLKLRKESDQLDQRAARLGAERQELDRIRQDIEGMRREIDERVITIRVDEAKNLRGLAQTYATLSPAAAVAILKEMDDSTVVKILSLMKADVTGPIFEAMAATPDGAPGGVTLAKRAALLSEKIRLMKSGVAPSTPTSP